MKHDPRLPRELRILLSMNDRAVEWYSALAMIGWGVVLSLPGDTLAGVQFVAFRRFGMTETLWAWAFGCIGMARVAALYINGRWPRGPAVRMIGAAFGAVSWGQIALLLAEGNIASVGAINPGVVVYALLAAFDLISVFRAGFDARYYDK